MDEASPTSDRYFDLSLRLLTIFVLVSLVCCVAFLIWRWVDSRFPRDAAVTVAPKNAVIESPAPAADAAPAPPTQVLMDPHKTFKCDERGKVTYSDRACDSGSVQMLQLNPPQPAAGSR